MRVAYFFDVDDTTIDSRHRVAPAENGDWDAYFKAAVHDTAMPWTKEYFKDGVFKYGEHFMLTSRSERRANETLHVLRREGILHDEARLKMKPQRKDERTPGRVHKLIALTRFAAYNPDTLLVHFDNCIETVACINSIRSERVKAFEFSYDSDPKVIDAICTFVEQMALNAAAYGQSARRLRRAGQATAFFVDILKDA